MTNFENLRGLLFSFSDGIKGGQIKGNYNEIKLVLENYNSEVSRKLRGDYLEEILHYSTKTTDFYKKVRSAELSNFPVINKNIVRNNFDLFLARDWNYKPYASVVTSGSTGTPFKVFHDKRKRTRNTSDTIVFSEYAGYRVGQKLYYFKIWNKINKKSRFSSFMQNVVSYDVQKLDPASIKKVVDTLANDYSKKGLLAYSSVYDEICRFLQENNSGPVSINSTSIIAMSEALSRPTKKMLYDYFGTYPVSRYSNVENGIIAQQLPDGSDEFLINEASYYVEILDLESDVIVQAGKPGRIVITDLFNYCMPLIRYDTGDIGVIAEKQILGYARPVFSVIEGRKMDLIYNTAGSLVSSYIITNNMWKYHEIKQYQFIQESSGQYTFILNTDWPFKRSEELKEEFKGYFGRDAVIRIEFVNEIPLLASGKRKKVINVSNHY